MSKDNRFSDLNTNDLESLENFKTWVLNFYPGLKQSKASEKELLIFTDYIRRRISEASNIDTAYWMKLLREVERKINAIERAEQSIEDAGI